jgi:hypothetical protein
MRRVLPLLAHACGEVAGLGEPVSSSIAMGLQARRGTAGAAGAEAGASLPDVAAMGRAQTRALADANWCELAAVDLPVSIDTHPGSGRRRQQRRAEAGA